MAQPFNYAIASPMDAFKESFAFGSALAKQKEQANRTAEVNKAIASIVNDRSPENIARNIMLFPELKEQIAASESILGDAERKAANTLRAEVISLYKAGNKDAARVRLEAQAQAYANTPGKEQQAKAAKTMLDAFDKDPDAVILPMSIQLAQSDENLYKNLFQNTEMTAFQKNLVAAGIDPKSEQGQQLAQQFVTNQADPIVEMETPNRTKFVGPRSEYFRRFGRNAPEPTAIPSPKSKAEYDALQPGEKYRAPDGSIKEKGGQTGASSSGNFRK